VRIERRRLGVQAEFQALAAGGTGRAMRLVLAAGEQQGGRGDDYQAGAQAANLVKRLNHSTAKRTMSR
jgi:hypothetical protein